MKILVLYSISKHIDVKLHLIRDRIENDIIIIKNIDIMFNPTYAFTKVLNIQKIDFYFGGV